MITCVTQKYKEIPRLTDAQAYSFWSNVSRREDDQCWNWRGPKRGVYGKFKINGEVFASHRVSYSISKGQINSNGAWGLIMHKCDNPRCCNPAHLEVGSPLTNAIDASAKGRLKKTFQGHFMGKAEVKP